MFINTPKGNKVRNNNMLQNSFKSIPGKMVAFVDQNIYSNFILSCFEFGFLEVLSNQLGGDIMRVGIVEKNSPSFFWHCQESVRITRVGIYQLCCLPAKVSVVPGNNLRFVSNLARRWEKLPLCLLITRTGKPETSCLSRTGKKTAFFWISMLIQNTVEVLLNDSPTCWSTVLCFASVPFVFSWSLTHLIVSNTSPDRWAKGFS